MGVILLNFRRLNLCELDELDSNHVVLRTPLDCDLPMSPKSPVRGESTKAFSPWIRSRRIEEKGSILGFSLRADDGNGRAAAVE